MIKTFKIELTFYISYCAFNTEKIVSVDNSHSIISPYNFPTLLLVILRPHSSNDQGLLIALCFRVTAINYVLGTIYCQSLNLCSYKYNSAQLHNFHLNKLPYLYGSSHKIRMWLISYRNILSTNKSQTLEYNLLLITKYFNTSLEYV